MEVVCLALVAVLAIQQVYFMRQIQKLVDKAMSRSFSEYQSAQRPPPPPKMPVDEGAPEDLRVLQSFIS